MCVLVCGGQGKASGVCRMAYQVELHNSIIQILNQCKYLSLPIQPLHKKEDRACTIWSMALIVFIPRQ